MQGNATSARAGWHWARQQRTHPFIARAFWVSPSYLLIWSPHPGNRSWCDGSRSQSVPHLRYSHHNGRSLLSGGSGSHSGAHAGHLLHKMVRRGNGDEISGLDQGSFKSSILLIVVVAMLIVLGWKHSAWAAWYEHVGLPYYASPAFHS